MKLTFLGAASTVTGSRYLVEDGGRRILVDCGLFQGLKKLRLRNWSAFPVEPASIHAIVLSHAHIDHSGYIPLLVKQGFRGPVYCSPATRDLCGILLPDSGHLQEEDAAHANRHGFSKHHPALPLYTEAEARACLPAFRAVDFGRPHAIGDGMSFTLQRAGHILGAASVQIRSESGTTVVFSGDIGRMNDVLMKPPAQVQSADYLVVESTYGDRLHDKTDPATIISAVVRRTAARGGSVLIPAFAVGRAQSILYILHMLKQNGAIPAHLPIFLDSPMAIAATRLLATYPNDHRLSRETCAALDAAAHYTVTQAESRAINDDAGVPKIIISASGMATGGRILHHFARHIEDTRSTILLAGYQAAGTRGATLAGGGKKLKFHGREWDVRAEIVKIDSLSAHADSEEIMSWLSHFSTPPRRTFITHGEPASAQTLKEKIEAELGWRAEVAADLQTEEF